MGLTHLNLSILYSQVKNYNKSLEYAWQALFESQEEFQESQKK